MPLYRCHYQNGMISDSQLPDIAEALTKIHCEETGAPADFVHAFFTEMEEVKGGYTASIFGTIRAGRSAPQKQKIHARMAQVLQDYVGLSADQVHVHTADVPASWVMEGGDVLPEPGEEAAWIARHKAKQAAATAAE